MATYSQMLKGTRYEQARLSRRHRRSDIAAGVARDSLLPLQRMLAPVCGVMHQDAVIVSRLAPAYLRVGMPLGVVDGHHMPVAVGDDYRPSPMIYRHAQSQKYQCGQQCGPSARKVPFGKRMTVCEARLDWVDGIESAVLACGTVTVGLVRSIYGGSWSGLAWRIWTSSRLRSGGIIFTLKPSPLSQSPPSADHLRCP